MAQRVSVLNHALKLLSSWKKIFLNLFKLAWLIPPFVLLVQNSSGWHLGLAILLLVLYPLVQNPVKIALASDLFDRAVADLEIKN